MKRVIAFFAAVMMLASCCGESSRIIKVNVPERPAGQEDVIALALPPIDTVRVGFIGLGMRGPGAVERFTYIPGAKIVALCDVEPERAESANEILRSHGLPDAALYSGSTEAYKGLCERDDINLVYIATDWKHHVPLALYAMQCGKHVAIEVPAATTLDEIWSLVNMAESKRLHCMMLENCCYDFFELSSLSMAQSGVFGEVIHGEGSYNHNLDPFWNEYWHSWRLDFNKENRGDVYPTHGLGPVAQAMNIHRGDRFTTLVSMDTDPFNGPKHIKARNIEGDFANGDVSCTLIRTHKGKTILIEHDVMTPRPYSRMYQLVGTDGYAGKYPVEQYCLRAEGAQNVDYQSLDGEKVYEGEELQALQAKYPNPILTPELEALAKKVGGHGGMDFIMDYRLVYCLRNGLPLDMDVYDMAEWCCLGELSRMSIAGGNAPVEVPDFTRGAWQKLSGFNYSL
ncbi:MAG: Gfo/Idh/MocA family oxidoreductase [Bacteroidales bacterium]|nr:Gfo/Idh/MocA family oxidoreductase [Bacteroidales bacterium]